MNRNTTTLFSDMPTAEISRSKFNRNHKYITTGNVGRLIPIDVQEVLPGDTVKINTSKVIRLQTPLTPFMDNIYADFYYFFVPNRLVWSHWQNFMGESDNGWLPSQEWTEPQITAPSGGWNKGTIANYMGIPEGVDNISISALPFRAYAKVCQDWFLPTSIADPLNIPVTDSDQTGTNGDSYINDVANGGMCFLASKYHDEFTSSLIAPQRGPAVSLNLAGATGAVYGTGKALALTDNDNLGGLTMFQANLCTAPTKDYFNQDVGDTVDARQYLGASKVLGVPTKDLLKTKMGNNFDSNASGLLAELDNQSLVNINELRQAFQLQKWYEKLARGGDRYISIIKSMFNVNSPDQRLQRSEYLGGNRVPLNVQQTVQTSATQYSSEANAIVGNPLGTTGAFSLTTDTHYDVEKSFTEHGYIIGLMVLRYHHSYQQGIAPKFLRKTRYDYYWPVFANLGEKAVKNINIYAQGSDKINPSTGKAYDDEVFGYQEAWYEYRYEKDMVTGEMSSLYATSLDPWHLADNYNTLPTLSDSWLREDKSNVDRVLSVQSSVADQFYADIWFEEEWIRPMPLYSIPGLMDHH